MSEFTIFAKWARNQDPNKINWEQVKSDYPDYNVDLLMSDFGIGVKEPESLMSFTPEPVSSLVTPGTRQKQLPIVSADKKPVSGIEDLMLKIPRIPKRVVGVSEVERVLLNLGIGGAEMTANTPAFLLDMAAKTTAAPFSKEARDALAGMPRQILEPISKLWGNILGLESEKFQYTPEQIEELKQHPEILAVPVLMAAGGPKAVRSVARAGRAIRTKIGAKIPVELRDITKIKVEPKAPKVKGEIPFKPKMASETGAVVNPIAEVSRLTSEMIEKAKMPPEIKAGVKEAKTSMIEHDRQIRRSESTSKLMEQTFERNVPDKARQELILHAIEQEHNPKYYNKLNEFEKGMVEWIDGELNKLDKFVKENNVVDLMPKEKGIRHIFHWWEDPKTGQAFASKYGKFSKGLPQAKQRQIPTYERGLELGYKPVSTNVGKIIGETWQSVMRAQQSREMFKTLYHIGAEKGVDIQLMKGREPKPIRMIERWDQLSKQGLTEGYIRYDNPLLDKAITFKSGDKLIMLKGATGIRKELYPFVKAYIESPDYGKLSELNFAAKSMKLGMSLFHVQSLAMQELANWRIPYKNIPRGKRLIKELNPEMRLLHQEGLDLWKGYEDVGYQNKFFTGATKMGKLGNIATKPIELMRSFIFDVVQPGMKASFAHDKFVKGLPKALKEGLTEQQWAREVVKMADGHFSHEHWKRSLLETNQWMVKAYFSPQSRKGWQNLLLSPTWQREHMLVAKNVAKSFMPQNLIKKLRLEPMSKTAKAQYRKYLLGAVMMVGVVDLYNQMSTKEMDGKAKHIWQNPSDKGFAVRAPWNEPSYKTESGRTIRGGAAYIRPLKSIYEVAEWGKDPLQKFIYKLSPALSAIGQQLWPGEYRHYEKGWKGYPERARDVTADLLLPISMGQATQVVEGKRDPLAAVFPFLGMPTSKIMSEIKYKR